MVKSRPGPLKRPRGQAKVLPPSPFLLGTDVTKTILAQGVRPKTNQELHSKLNRLVSAWVTAACVWSDAEWSLGDYRFVVFSIKVAPKIEVFVQLWSEPIEPVYWEVSSGRWNPPADKWLSGDRAERIKAFGFEIGGRAENFQKEVLIQSRANLTSVALTVIDILYAGFDYRGTARLEARICYESRAKSSRCWSPARRKTLERCSFTMVTGCYTIIMTKMRRY
jgi:hypothetical protein